MDAFIEQSVQNQQLNFFLQYAVRFRGSAEPVNWPERFRSRFSEHDRVGFRFPELLETVNSAESQAALSAENLPPPPQLPPPPRHDFTVTELLNASQSTQKHNLISQSRCNETPIVVDQEGITHLDSDTLLSGQTMAAMLIDRQENPNEDFGSDEVGMVGEGAAEGRREEDQLNSGCSGKWKRKEKIRAEERRNKTTNGGRIGISLEEILLTKGMSLKDAANNLEVSRSTLKRYCREYDITRWPPRKKHKLISQSCKKHKLISQSCREYDITIVL